MNIMVNLTFAFQSILKDCDSFTTACLLRHGKTKFDVIEQKTGLKIGEIEITEKTASLENKNIDLVVEYNVDTNQYVAYLDIDDSNITTENAARNTHSAPLAYLYDYEK